MKEETAVKMVGDIGVDITREAGKAKDSLELIGIVVQGIFAIMLVVAAVYLRGKE